MCGKTGFLACLLLEVSAQGQVLLSADQARRVNHTMDAGVKGERLNCHIEPVKPFLDFAFRFELGYIVRCQVNEFGGRASTVGFYLRVRSPDHEPVIFGQRYSLPAMPEEIRSRVNLQKVHAELGASGVAAIGEGHYSLDLLLMDDRGRVLWKRWKAEAHTRGNEQQASLALPAGAVASLEAVPWHRKPEEKTLPENRAGLRVTVLLNAAPVNPYSSKLRAWDRAFLLNSLGSLLNALPVKTVRLVAFSLEQQREVYRTDDLDEAGFVSLDRALGSLELGTVPYSVLQQQLGWYQLLLNLTNDEVNAPQPADAVIFLGPHARIDEKGPSSKFQRGSQSTAPPPFFYLQFYPRYGADFPDAIAYVTSACDGTTFKMHSPGDFADAIRKLQRKLGMERETASR